MKYFLRLPLYLLTLVILVCALSVFFGVGDTAYVPLEWKLSNDDIARAKSILREGSKTRPESIGAISLDKQDLNLAANYFLNRYSKSAVNVSLKKNQLKFTVTMTLPKNSLGKYLNTTIAFGNVEGKPLPTITQFKAGKLLLPPALAAFAIDYFIRHSSLDNSVALVTRPIKNIQIDPTKITITYFSSMETLVQAKRFLIQSEDPGALTAYRKHIKSIVNQHDPKWRLSLAKLLQGAFSLARQRSTPETAVTENRLAILAVNEYVNKAANPLTLHHRSGGNRYYPTFLYKRNDLAQHFIASAALAASIDGRVASVLGEEKELSDSQRGGSGFSFVDLAADKAGTRLGETAVVSQQSALKLQQTLANTLDYRDFMPDPTGLPEHMGQTEFQNRYQSVHSQVYLELTRQIDAKISALPIYENPE